MRAVGLDRDEHTVAVSRQTKQGDPCKLDGVRGGQHTCFHSSRASLLEVISTTIVITSILVLVS